MIASRIFDKDQNSLEDLRPFNMVGPYDRDTINTCILGISIFILMIIYIHCFPFQGLGNLTK